MKVISKALFPLAERAIRKMKEAYGEGKALLVTGAWLGIDKNPMGDDVAVFYTVKGDFYIDAAEKSLKVFLGDIRDGDYAYGVLVSEDPVNTWKKKQAELRESLKHLFEESGMEKEAATIEAMYGASGFGEVKKGNAWGGAHTDDVTDLVECAFKNVDSVDLRISKQNAPYWDGHISIEVLNTEKRKEEESHE